MEVMADGGIADDDMAEGGMKSQWVVGRTGVGTKV